MSYAYPMYWMPQKYETKTRVRIIKELLSIGWTEAEIGQEMGGVSAACIKYHIARYIKKTWTKSDIGLPVNSPVVLTKNRSPTFAVFAALARIQGFKGDKYNKWVGDEI